LADEILQQARCLIVVKAFNHRTMKVCGQAKQLGVPVILDLCDDVFDPSYGTLGGDMTRHYFAGMANLAAAIVTTTSVLADKVRERLPAETPVYIVPDMVERATDTETLTKLYPPIAVNAAPPPVKPKKKRRPTLLKRIRRTARKSGRSILIALGYAEQRAPLIPSVESAPAPPPELGDDESGRIVLWFGHHGSSHSDTGMAQLLWLAGDLTELSRTYQFRLVVISNSIAKFRQIIQPLPFATHYVNWTPSVVHAYLKRADVCVVPFGHDSFSLAKSPNRILLSLASGVPVVSSYLPSLKPLEDCLLIENWYNSIKTYFDSPETVRDHLASAAKVISEHFDGTKISMKWQEVIKLTDRNREARQRKRRILFFFQLVQDFDLLVPLVHSAKDQFDVSIGILSRLALNAPERLKALGKQGVRTFFLHETEISTLDPRDPRIGCDLLVTASESSAGPHIFARRLVEVVKANGTATATLQHGVENVGLTYRDDRYDQNISFASDFILTWGGPEQLAEWVSEETRSKVVPVGCPKPVVEKRAWRGFPLADQSFIGIFENLHWSRYSDEFRSCFLADLAAAARAFPDTTFVLKPHPAGKWSTTQAQAVGMFPGNVVVADPNSPIWAPFGADAFLAFARGIVTTPSTTAFDAARYERPVAVAAYDTDVSIYDPLPRLSSELDWIKFIRCVDVGAISSSEYLAFRSRVSLPGDASPRFLAVFCAACDGKVGAHLVQSSNLAAHAPAANVVPSATSRG
jgi:glycosyltransferase involved in cell wall biosynthesis